MVALDADRQVIRPAKLWNDTESAADAAWLLDQLDSGAAAWAAACGSVPVAGFTITKLSWLHRKEPASWERPHVVLPHDWLTFRLTDRLVTDRGDASGTGYWSPATGAYRFDLLGIVDGERDWSTVVPEVLGPFDRAGEWRGAVVAAGTGDNMAAALGVGLRPGDVAISIGTSGTVYTVSEQPTADATGAVAGFADATGRFLPLVCTLNATKVTEAARRLLGVDHAVVRRARAGRAARCAGARRCCPTSTASARRTDRTPPASWAGCAPTSTAPTSPGRRRRGGLRACSTDSTPCPRSPCATVGSSSSAEAPAPPAYRRVLADLTGRAVVVPAADEHVAAGACVQAAAVLTGTDPAALAEAWGLGERRRRRAHGRRDVARAHGRTQHCRIRVRRGRLDPSNQQRRAMGTTTVNCVPAGIAAPLA